MTQPSPDLCAVERPSSSKHKRHRSKSRDQRHRSKSQGKSKEKVHRSKSRDQRHRNKVKPKESTKVRRHTKEEGVTKSSKETPESVKETGAMNVNQKTNANPKRLNYHVDHLSHFRYNSTREGVTIDAYIRDQDDTSFSDVTGSWSVDDFSDDGKEKETPDWHEFIKGEDWNGLLKSIRDTPSKALKRAILKTQSVQKETLLHRLCYKLPTEMTLKTLKDLEHRGVVPDIILKARDAAGNTVLHTACSKLRLTAKSKERRVNRMKSAAGEESEQTESTEDLSDWDSSNNQDDQKICNQKRLPVLDFQVIKQLILIAPELLSTTNAAGDSPLHALVSSPGFSSSNKKKYVKAEDVMLQAEMQAEEALNNILNLLPREIALQSNCAGKTVLHYAIAHTSYERVLMRLLRRLPELASVADRRGMLPLHYIAASVSGDKIPWTFSQDVVKAFPAALVAQTKKEGDTPLHALVYTVQQRKHDHDEKAKKKKSKNKKRSGHSSHSDFYMDRNTSKLAELLTQLVPNDKRERKDSPCCAMVMFNEEGYTSMHACVSGVDTPDRILRILLQSSTAKTACMIQTQRTERSPSSFGSTPLHLALARRIPDIGIVEALVDVAPYACEIQDHVGQVPLSVALQNEAVGSTLLKLLIRRFPDAIDIPRHDKYCPIHLALQGCHVDDIVCRAILQAHENDFKTTESLMQVTKNGDTPLHLACKRPGISKSLIQMLLLHFHGAKFFRNHDGDLPYDICLKANPQLLQEIPHLAEETGSPQ